MKLHSFVTLSLVALVTAAQGEISVLNRPPMRTAPTNEELIVQLRKSDQEMAEAAKSKPLSTPEDLRPKEVPDLISMSEILCYNGAVTLVPKGAILEYPKNLADRLKHQPGSKVQNWDKFFENNQGWITTVEVTKAQAQGKHLLPEEKTIHISKCGKLVVATLNGAPITVLPPQAPEAAAPAPAKGTPASTSNPAKP